MRNSALKIKSLETSNYTIALYYDKESGYYVEHTVSNVVTVSDFYDYFMASLVFDLNVDYFQTIGVMQ